MAKDPYLENGLQIRASELDNLTNEEIFEEGYYAGQTWNTLPISDAVYKDSDELILYAVLDIVAPQFLYIVFTDFAYSHAVIKYD